jgi:hypothetical protein
MQSNVTRIVEEVVSTDPCLSYTLSSGLVNYSALAERIRPTVERLYGGPVKQNTIVQCLRRLSRKMDLVDYTSMAESIAEADYQVIKGIRELSLPTEELGRLASTVAATDLGSGTTAIIFVADRTTTLLVDERLADLLGTTQSGEEYTLLKISLKGEYSGVPGLSAYIAQVLGSSKITPRNIIRRGNQIYVVFSKRDSELLFRAMDKLQNPLRLSSKVTRSH